MRGCGQLPPAFFSVLSGEGIEVFASRGTRQENLTELINEKLTFLPPVLRTSKKYSLRLLFLVWLAFSSLPSETFNCGTPWSRRSEICWVREIVIIIDCFIVIIIDRFYVALFSN